MVIAERDKKMAKYLFWIGVFCVALSLIIGLYSIWEWVLFLLGLLAVGGGIDTWWSPKTAIRKEKGDLCLQYTWHTRRISIADVEYAACQERWHRERGWLSLYRHTNDIGTIIITVKQNGMLKHLYMRSILNTSAVVATINGLVEERKNKKNTVNNVRLVV